MKQAQIAIRKIDLFSRAIFISLAALTVAMIAAYIVFVNKAVLNAVAKEKIETQIASLNSDLSEKEFEYINGKGEVTMELASRLGFVSASNNTTFVTLAKPAAAVAIR